MTKPAVALVRCGDHDPVRVREAVRGAIELLPCAKGLIKPGLKVLLKPNLLSVNDPPERAVNTHPEFVRAVAAFFIARGCKVVIGDSCGSLSPGSTGRAIRTTGLDRVANEVGAEIVDFDKAPSVEVEVADHRVLERVRIPRLIREVDLFVTLPKLKTHGLTLLTGAVKNQMGLISGRGKKDIHLAAPKPAALANAVLDIYSVARPHLAVMDAVVGMEGNGPAAGRPREIGLVIAGDDCSALDTVAAEIMGYDPGEIDTLRLGRERGLGVGRLDEIALLGAPLHEVIVPDFKKPALHGGGAAALALIPTPLLRWFFHVVGSTYATVMDDRCILCGECVANCPAGALREVNGRMEVDRRRCIACYCCSEVCNHRAIVMKRPLPGRLIHGLRQLVRR